jgi:hypothetical protein
LTDKAPLCRHLYPGNYYILQLDGATSHTSSDTRAPREETPEFIKKDEWHPQSPNLNPMDYTMWDTLSEKVYAGRTEKFTEHEVKDKIQEKWA